MIQSIGNRGTGLLILPLILIQLIFTHEVDMPINEVAALAKAADIVDLAGCCCLCKFFKSDDFDEEQNISFAQGWCTRFPPVFIGQSSLNERGDPPVFSYEHPAVCGHIECGEYVREPSIQAPGGKKVKWSKTQPKTAGYYWATRGRRIFLMMVLDDGSFYSPGDPEQHIYRSIPALRWCHEKIDPPLLPNGSPDNP